MSLSLVAETGTWLEFVKGLIGTMQHHIILYSLYNYCMAVGAENLLSSAAADECSDDNTSSGVRGFLPRKCTSLFRSIKTCHVARVQQGLLRLQSMRILIYLPILRKISLPLTADRWCKMNCGADLAFDCSQVTSGYRGHWTVEQNFREM